MEPFLKWAGGKRWLVSSPNNRKPEQFNRYIEPFLGSGAMYFSLRPRHAVLSDLNSDLIDLYTVIRDNPMEFRELIALHHSNHDKEYYYNIRKIVPSNKLERAARTLYLNRTCWNGLYRVNLKGDFNVPIGTKTAVLLENEDFCKFSDTLKSAEISCCDFEESINKAQDQDFLFVDPPYTVQHNMNGFVKYNEKIFSWNDQLRLRDALQRALNRGAYIVLTNADHASVRELYADLLAYRSVERSSVLAANRTKRGKVTEAMFFGGFCP